MADLSTSRREPQDITGLHTAVRQSEDAAIAAQRALDHFRPIYRAALGSGDDIRIAELYALVLGKERAVREAHFAADLFGQAANLIYHLENRVTYGG